MTRINVVPPVELCDQHLLAEHRELTRIPNCVARNRYNLAGAPDQYTLGKGHVKFFYSRLRFLRRRYDQLHRECLARGFNVQDRWPTDLRVPQSMWRDYTPTGSALAVNRERIAARMPAKARFTNGGITRSVDSRDQEKVKEVNDMLWSDQELIGMWQSADFCGGETDAERYTEAGTG